MRVYVPYRTASRETYKRFCEENHSIKLSYNEWCNILYTFIYNFRDHMLNTGERAKLLHGIGDFAVSKKKPKRIVTDRETGEEHVNLPIDWPKSRKAGKHIYHMNYHTEGFKFKWRWFVETARFFKHDIWVFRPSRISSRLIAHYIKQDPSVQYKYKEWHLLDRVLKRKKKHEEST